jgi:hypothetical protein
MSDHLLHPGRIANRFNRRVHLMDPASHEPKFQRRTTSPPLQSVEKCTFVLGSLMKPYFLELCLPIIFHINDQVVSQVNRGNVLYMP